MTLGIDKFVVQQIGGTKFICLYADANLTPEAIKYGTICLEHQLFNLAECQSLQPGDVVLDVGAFIGDTARWFLDKGCKVFAFEPYPDAFICLSYNCPEAECFNAAVGNGEPVCQDCHDYDRNLGTRGVKRLTTSTPESSPCSLRLDDLKFDRVDMIKIDVEGYEPAVIDGAVETILRHKPIVIVECFPDRLLRCGYPEDAIEKRLTKLGMDLRVAIGAKTDVRWDYVAKFQSDQGNLK